MMQRFRYWIAGLKNNGVVQTSIGFLSFLIIAAVVMLFLESSEEGSGIKDLLNSLWFSIVTITTVGYGDISPISPSGKVAAVVIMMIGILYIGVVTGNITSWLVERNRRKVFGLVPIKKKQGHLLVLGWRPEMGRLLRSILDLHQMDSSFLVLVNNADAQKVNDLRQDIRLKEISHFSGDFTNREVLANACAASASKVLILSDSLIHNSIEEVDFKAVLATIAIKRLNPKIYTIVEIIQPQFSIYLQHVDVEEIVFNHSNSRALISNLALMSGLINVYARFFDLKDGLLRIEPISSSFTGTTFIELKQQFKGCFIIGLLENTGNLRRRKSEKMDQIQKAVSIQRAINGLNEIKTMQSNVPVFHPSPHYKIKDKTSLITLDVSASILDRIELSPEIVGKDSRRDDIQAEGIEQLLKQTLKLASSSQSFHKMLQQSGLRISYKGEIPEGILHNETLIPVKTLELSRPEYQDFTKYASKNQLRKNLVLAIFEQTVRISEDWDEFWEGMQQRGVRYYLYRNRINGFEFENRKYSFKSLGIPIDVSEEINSHLQSKDDYSSTSTVKGAITHRNLASYLNGIKSKNATIKPSGDGDERVLLICGWKPQLVEMLSFIISEYPDHASSWNKISIVGNISAEQSLSFQQQFGQNVDIELHQGGIVDRKVLKKAGVSRAVKVIILAETESGKTNEEIDSQTVLSAMLIGSLNKKAYKIAEILDRRYRESLEQANVEEIFLNDRFTQIMLSSGSHGSGVSRVISEMINLETTSLKLSSIEPHYLNGSFIQLVRDKYLPGELIVGLLEDTGNIYSRKSEKIHQAQIQSNIKEQVEALKKVKRLVPNNVVFAPDPNHRIKPHSKLVILKTTDKIGWAKYGRA